MQVAQAGEHQDDENERERGPGQDQYDIVDGQSAAADLDASGEEHCRVDRDETDAEFGRPEAEEREAENAAQMVVDEDVDADEVIADQREQGRVHANVECAAEARHDHEIADRIDRVIEKIAVDRAFDAPIPRQAAVERIAEPMDDQAECRDPQEGRIEAARNVAGEDDNGAPDTDEREMVGLNGRRQALAQPCQQAAFAFGHDVRLYARHAKPAVLQQG